MVRSRSRVQVPLNWDTACAPDFQPSRATNRSPQRAVKNRFNSRQQQQQKRPYPSPRGWVMGRSQPIPTAPSHEQRRRGHGAPSRTNPTQRTAQERGVLRSQHRGPMLLPHPVSRIHMQYTSPPPSSTSSDRTRTDHWPRNPARERRKRIFMRRTGVPFQFNITSPTTWSSKPHLLLRYTHSPYVLPDRGPEGQQGEEKIPRTRPTFLPKVVPAGQMTADD